MPVPEDQKTEPPAKGKRKPRKETDPRIKTLLDAFSARHKERFGFDYVPSRVNDKASMKALLDVHDEATLTQCIDAFFADQDEFLDGKRNVGMFRARINTYVQLLSTKEAPQPAYFKKLK